METAGQEGDAGGLRQRGSDAAADAAPTEPANVPTGPDTGAHRKNRRKTLLRRFMGSPAYKILILSIMSITPVYGNLYAMPKFLDARGVTGFFGRLANYALTIWISVMFVYNFFMTQFTDPGGCSLVRPAREATGQYELDLSGGEGGATGDCDKDGRPSKLFYAPSWCDLCKHWKTPRSHHCSICQRCVLRMDHHCPITGNCIGMKNHGHFLLFYIFALAGLTYSMTSCVVAILYGHWYQTPESKALQAHVDHYTGYLIGIPGFLIQVVLKVFGFSLTRILVVAGVEVAMQTVFTAIAFCFVLACGCSALHLAGKNSTLLELSFPMKEYVQLKPQVFCPLGPGFYNCGWRANFRDLLGDRWRLRLLLPVRGGPLSLLPAVSPRPSALGADALLQRVVQVEEHGVKNQVASCQELGINPGPPGSTAADGV